MFYAPQSETKDGGAVASWRKDAPPSDKGQKIHIFSMRRTKVIDRYRSALLGKYTSFPRTALINIDTL